MKGTYLLFLVFLCQQALQTPTLPKKSCGTYA